jgi:ADP-ribosylglycohydrolase
MLFPHGRIGPVTTVLDRIAGGLLGVHAGDSLGATVEFKPWSEIRSRYPEGVREIVGGGPFNWPPGHATDDTDLTRAVLLAYLEPGADLVRTAADHMVDWYEGSWPGRKPGQRPADIGNATAWGLRKYLRTGDPRDAGAGRGKAGNGSLMRCVPTALAVTDRDRRVRESMEISAITHDDERCTAACAAYNEIAAALLAGASPSDAVTAGRDTAAALGASTAGRDTAAALGASAGRDTATALDAPAVADAIESGRALRPAVLAASGPGETFPGEAGGYVLESLTLAVAAVLDPRPYPDVVIDVVRVGRDTDTNGAIAGGLLGIRDGAGAIPSAWVAKLQFADEFTAAAETLARRWPSGRSFR